MIEPLTQPLPSLDTTVDPTRWDRFGVTLSALCMVHCLGLPLVALLSPVLAFPESHAFHVALLALVAPIALIALAAGFRRHRNWTPVLVGAAGVGLLILAVTPSLPALFERILTLAGGALLVVAHLGNSRLASCGGPFWRFKRHTECPTAD